MNKPGSYEELFQKDRNDNTDWNIAVREQRKAKAETFGKRTLMSLLLRLRKTATLEKESN